MDRDRAQRVAQRAERAERAVIAGAHDPRGRGHARQAAARERHGGEVDRGQLPQGGELGRGVHAAMKRRQRVALAAQHARTVEAEQTVTHGRGAFDQAILRADRPQLGGDPLARGEALRDHAQIPKEQRAVLDVEAGAQLGVLEHRTVATPIATQQVLLAPVGEVRLVAPVQVARIALEEHRRSASARAARTRAQSTRPSRSSGG